MALHRVRLVPFKQAPTEGGLQAGGRESVRAQADQAGAKLQPGLLKPDSGPGLFQREAITAFAHRAGYSVRPKTAKKLQTSNPADQR